MLQKKLLRKSIDIDTLPELIANSNKLLINEWQRPHPLASGNCGNFAIAFSNFLKFHDIDHDIRVFSEYNYKRGMEKTEEAIDSDCNDLIRAFVPGAHVAVCIENKIYDFLGVSSIPTLIQYMKDNWGDEHYWHFKVSSDDEKLPEYCLRSTSYWMEVEDFEEHISKNWL